ncbi:MAG TPA: ABC transporter permease [Clostridiaceae bacterium]|nr:ABC transporter permease [Clostridiaceae bacterium]
MTNIKNIIEKVGLPRLIIGFFFVLLLILALALGLDAKFLFSDVIRRWMMYSILVLAMVPGVQSGIGLNFGISLGVVSGLLGVVIAMEIAFVNGWFYHMGAVAAWLTLLLALAISIVVSALVGAAYGLLLNRVKGSEMTVSTYVGFSSIALMNIVWIILRFKNGQLGWPIGSGLRNTASLQESFGGLLSDPKVYEVPRNITIYAEVSDVESISVQQPKALNFLAIDIGGFVLPVALILFFALCCLVVWLFFRSKTGIAMSAAGENELFTISNGINVDRMRILGTSISTVLGAIGIIMYAQTYGFLQLYNAPLMMGFTAVASVLLGGATVNRAKISNVIIGTLLFQGILTVALPVANEVINVSTLPEVLRIIISNGIILYALSKTRGGNQR